MIADRMHLSIGRLFDANALLGKLPATGKLLDTGRFEGGKLLFGTGGRLPFGRRKFNGNGMAGELEADMAAAVTAAS